MPLQREPSPRYTTQGALINPLARISNMSLGYRIFADLRRLYSCGSQRAGDAPEVSTLWVRNKTSHFSSLSMPR